jgi:hypothetical protein
MSGFDNVWDLVLKPAHIHPDLMPAVMHAIEYRDQQTRNRDFCNPMMAVRAFVDDLYIRVPQGSVLDSSKERNDALAEAKAEAEAQWIAAAWRFAMRSDLPMTDLDVLCEAANDGNGNVDARILKHLKHPDTPEFDRVFPEGNEISVDELSTRLRELQSLHAWITSTVPVIGHYRMFIPVVEDVTNGKDGWLVSAVIHVIRRSDIQLPDDLRVFAEAFSGQNKLLVAPWTCYKLIDDEAKALSKLRLDLHGAVKCAGKCLPRHRSNAKDELIYLLELQPISPDDVALGLSEFQNLDNVYRAVATAGKLSAKKFDVTGESVGLGIFLAAVAAKTGISFRSCIASGAIHSPKVRTGDFEIADVGGIEGKLNVIEAFLSCVSSPNSFRVVLPLDNPGLKGRRLGDLVKSVLHQLPRNLSDALAPDQLVRVFTDGFDAWRELLSVRLMSDASGGVTKLPAVFGKHTVLDSIDVDVSASTSDSDFLLAEKQVYQRALEAMAAFLECKESPPAFHRLISVPYNSEPRIVSDWLCFRACTESWSGKWTGEQISDAPVLLPVYLDLLDHGEQFSGVVPDLGELIQRSLLHGPRPLDRNERPFGVDVQPDAIRNALHRPRKLLLVVSDRKSRDVSYTDGATKSGKSRRAVWKKLSELANSGQIAVLMICPDDHYCRMAGHQISTLR